MFVRLLRPSFQKLSILLSIFFVFSARANSSDANYLAKKCEALLESWVPTKSPEMLAIEIKKRLFVKESWDGDGMPRFFRHVGELNAEVQAGAIDRFDEFNRWLKAWNSKKNLSITDGERKIFGVNPNAVLNENILEFDLTHSSPYELTLEAYSPEHHKVGEVPLDLEQAALGYVDSIDESVERFESSIARRNGESFEDHWLTLTSSMFRLFIVKDFSDLAKVAFAIPVYTEIGSGRRTAPQSYEIRRQPLEIFLLRACTSNQSSIGQIHLINRDGQWKSWCALPIGYITRPSRPGSNWIVTG